jgi:triphosphoribosyl-dephospho-CoA synthase
MKVPQLKFPSAHGAGQGDWTAGQVAALACQLEVAIPKPGNVHRGADFADTTLYDFLVAGQILGRTLDAHANATIGRTVLEAVRATRDVTGNNPNLGIVLLLVPLAKRAESGQAISVEGMRDLLDRMSMDDARDVYRAIRLARPGGLGQVGEADVAAEPTYGLVEAMRLASQRDAVAAEYAQAFAATIERHAPQLATLNEQHGRLDRAVIELLARQGDSLILRKCGQEVSDAARARASRCLDARSGGWAAFEAAAGELDFWLRADGNRRNPGTTADLIAAALFVGLWRGELWPGAR